MNTAAINLKNKCYYCFLANILAFRLIIFIANIIFLASKSIIFSKATFCIIKYIKSIILTYTWNLIYIQKLIQI